ncbi:FkbM family methyltransferase [Frigidibacter sp. ROC022]|uniref:FkbM family methyltransferase n=1 Tax=Frigidibacter sp. ROC022 TaxID=2971796 RepID=UPI00215AD693|nr:FkbM family methyltransferase [Frigidibacter sp. ROC022]MCR8723708.1 FkbM family methyltransferase [Frigidibacter sp. ROC022]
MNAQPPILPSGLPPIAERLAGRAKGRPLRLAPMEQVLARIDGTPVQFHLNMENDPIQHCHRHGRFYEAEELAELVRLVPKRASILDVGANVGNHALFFALFHDARRIIVVEPNPLALEPLVANVLGNRLDHVIQLQYLGFGLADRDEAGFSMKPHDRNLGATRMFAGTDGPFSVRRGDGVFPRARPDLVKIDVEGMEMQVLEGLEALIARARPVLMVEVNHANADAFAEWAAGHHYRTHLTRRVGRANDNHILLPDTPEAVPTEDKENA